ncbi:hypothetical protein H4217_007264 [Coemansia sp. RSA 1939]|nr:hypothetical protein H4217_007264 [Coemansia sp. RSA 1939]KAJ2609365.1 hypothetical protein EV177_004499 [Coemansia sp. RSA 1804]
MSSPIRTGSVARQTCARPASQKQHRRQSQRRRQTNSYMQGNQYPGFASMPILSSLPTPPVESTTHHANDPKPQDLVPFMMAANADVSFPLDKRPLLSFAEKIHAANVALVHSWGRFLTGTAVHELCDDATLLRGRRVISIIDLPSNFCIAPVDEQICPSDDQTRMIAIVSNAGLIIDIGMYNLSGPIFYKGSVVGSSYIFGHITSEEHPQPLTSNTPLQQPDEMP